MSPNMILISYFIKHDYDVWFENEKLSDKAESIDKEESTDLLSYLQKYVFQKNKRHKC